MVGSRLVKCFSENFSGELYVYPCTQDAQPSTCTRLCSVYGPRNGSAIVRATVDWGHRICDMQYYVMTDIR